MSQAPKPKATPASKISSKKDDTDRGINQGNDSPDSLSRGSIEPEISDELSSEQAKNYHGMNTGAMHPHPTIPDSVDYFLKNRRFRTRKFWLKVLIIIIVILVGFILTVPAVSSQG